MWMSVNDLIRKLNDYVSHSPEVNREGFIRDAWVCSRNDREYPEGTVVFEVVDNNATLKNFEDTTHLLTIYPDRIGIIN